MQSAARWDRWLPIIVVSVGLAAQAAVVLYRVSDMDSRLEGVEAKLDNLSRFEERQKRLYFEHDIPYGAWPEVPTHPGLGKRGG